MTTILADAKKGVMVCDSMASYGDSWFPVTKVYRVGNELIGWAGQYSEGPRWLDWYAAGQRGKMPSIGNIAVLILGGSCYEHTEEYLGPQGNQHWRGFFVLHEVQDGAFDEMPVSLSFINQRYPHVTYQTPAYSMPTAQEIEAGRM